MVFEKPIAGCCRYWLFQEREITAFFDEPQSPYSGELDYEYRMFKLMEDLCTLLNEKP